MFASAFSGVFRSNRPTIAPVFRTVWQKLNIRSETIISYKTSASGPTCTQTDVRDTKLILRNKFWRSGVFLGSTRLKELFEPLMTSKNSLFTYEISFRMIRRLTSVKKHTLISSSSVRGAVKRSWLKLLEAGLITENGFNLLFHDLD